MRRVTLSDGTGGKLCLTDSAHTTSVTLSQGAPRRVVSIGLASRDHRGRAVVVNMAAAYLARFALRIVPRGNLDPYRYVAKGAKR